MKRERAIAILSEPIETLSISYGAAGPLMRGRLLRLEDKTLAVGRFVAEGDEAIVHELVDVNSGERELVLKVCRHPPASPKYTEWAVPFRVEGNSLAELADVELNTASLVQVSGVWIKVQPYVSKPNKIDWQSRSTIALLLHQHAEWTPEKALAHVARLRDTYGPQGLLCEAVARIHIQAGQWEQAEAALKEAVALYQGSQSSLRLGALLQLGKVYRELYARFESPGDATMQLKLDDGTVLTQQLFSDPADAALDDGVQDRSCFTLLEALGEEPLLVPGLLGVAEDFADHIVDLALALAERAQRVNPGVDELDAFIEMLQSRLSASVGQGFEQRDEPSFSERRDDLDEHMAAFNEAYQPDRDTPQTDHGRDLAFRAHMMRGDYLNALDVAGRWCELNPDGERPQVARLSSLVELQRYEEADVLGTRLREQFPESAEVLEALHRLSVAVEDFDNALRYALLLVHGGPAHARRGALLASEVYRYMDSGDEAACFAERAFADDFSEEAYVLNYVYALRCLARQGQENALEREQELIARALEAEPSSTAYLFCHAQSLGLAGCLDAVPGVLRQILELEPGHIQAQGFLQALEASEHEEGEGGA